MNVLSLFGGIECGMASLKSIGIPVTRYFSAEVDEYAKKCAAHNFPEIVHIGSVTDVFYKEKTGGLYFGNS